MHQHWFVYLFICFWLMDWWIGVCKVRMCSTEKSLLNSLSLKTSWLFLLMFSACEQLINEALQDWQQHCSQLAKIQKKPNPSPFQSNRNRKHIKTKQIAPKMSPKSFSASHSKTLCKWTAFILHLYPKHFTQALYNLCLSFTHHRRLAAMQSTNQLIRSYWGFGVLLRDTSTHPGWDRTGNPPTARWQLLPHEPYCHQVRNKRKLHRSHIELDLSEPAAETVKLCVYINHTCKSISRFLLEGLNGKWTALI